MAAIRLCALPTGAFLQAYASGGAYTDCYVIELSRMVTQDEFVEAFYTSSVFKVERWPLAKFLSRPSTDADAHCLAVRSAGTFSAWSVEKRESNQILLAAGRTRSWLMAEPSQSSSTGTKLYFGSAVLPRRARGGQVSRMGWQFRVLVGVHMAYSRVLLASACRKLAKFE